MFNARANEAVVPGVLVSVSELVLVGLSTELCELRRECKLLANKPNPRSKTTAIVGSSLVDCLCLPACDVHSNVGDNLEALIS